MGHRTLKRVPLDFDWPRDQTWQGYLMPTELGLPTCTDCGGEGYGREARAIAGTFYPHMIGGPNADALAWCDKLGQAEVDNLVARGRLSVWRDGGWQHDPRDAAEINARQKGGGGFDAHDAINRMYLVEFRCEQLGIVDHCPTCHGEGTVGSDAAKAAVDAWKPTEPPAGDGWQLWETVTEGSPVSPVFATAAELADWCVSGATLFADHGVSRDEWLAMFLADEVDGGSLMVGVFRGR